MQRGGADKIKGWILDAYPSSEGMVLWIITEDDQRIRLIDLFHPSFYFDGPKRGLRKVLAILSRETSPLLVKEVERTEFFSAEPTPVVQVTVQNPLRFSRVVQKIVRMDEPDALIILRNDP